MHACVLDTVHALVTTIVLVSQIIAVHTAKYTSAEAYHTLLQEFAQVMVHVQRLTIVRVQVDIWDQHALFIHATVQHIILHQFVLATERAQL